MELFVKDAFKRVGETFPFKIEQKVSDTEFDKRQVRFSKPVCIEGSYVFDGKAFSVSGAIDAVLESVCARCNEPFEERITIRFSERFVRQGTRMSDDEVYEYAGDRIELEQAVMDNLFLHIPLASICKEDCRGLCPDCGVNLNTTECSCSR